MQLLMCLHLKTWCGGQEKKSASMCVCFPIYQVGTFYPIYNILIHVVSTVAHLKYSWDWDGGSPVVITTQNQQKGIKYLEKLRR